MLAYVIRQLTDKITEYKVELYCNKDTAKAEQAIEELQSLTKRLRKSIEVFTVLAGG